MARPRLVLAPLALLSLVAHASSSEQWRGISPQMLQKLRTVSSFHCDDRRQQLPLSRLNDNYCDCADGSDEPGTSACSHTKAVFHCENAGFFATDLPTSRVNDGVCDCCDGSDEYASGASCASQCANEMQRFMEDKKELMQQVDAGLKDRAVLVAEGHKRWNEEELKMRQLEANVASLRVNVEQLNKTMEQEERVEKEEKERRTAASKREILRQLGLLDLTKEQLTSIILEIGREGMSAKHDMLPIIRKEREAAVGVDEEVEKTPMDEEDEAFRERDEARQEETRRIEKLIKQRTKDREEAAKAEKVSEEEADEDDESAAGSKTDASVDDDEDDQLDSDDLELPEVETHPIDLLYEELAVAERYESTQAVSARKEHEDANKKAEEEERKLSEAQKMMDKDYGVDRVFFGLRDKCVESSTGEYTYKVCFFGQATQDRVILGDMEDIKGPEMQDSEGLSVAPEAASSADKAVKQIKFSNGQTCWNGPRRSLTVTLECGPEPTVLSGIEEPSMCVYLAKLRTPAVCSEDDRKRILTFDDAQVTPHHIEIEVLPTL
ncbi:unnamed protein product [Hyaloperonospora brassicae]|uniref:Glucosidase 2 subunit beta n=1 Tax=Hyaloperonospora brassicae TaxID=162125 RepID=A0AAV0UN75_HYABA|nr:unnamed protein product [Hyaloperonospora brassicae]